MKKTGLALFFGALCACGGGGSGNTGEPPPTVIGGGSVGIHALVNGTFYFERLYDLQDGCGRNPLDPRDPITSVAFNLQNDGNGKITLDRCIYQGRSTTGHVQDNSGSLHVLHSLRRDGSVVVAEYQQECLLSIEVTDDNFIEGRSVEHQRNRNDVMKRVSGVNADTCTTSYGFSLRKR